MQTKVGIAEPPQSHLDPHKCKLDLNFAKDMVRLTTGPTAVARSQNIKQRHPLGPRINTLLRKREDVQYPGRLLTTTCSLFLMVMVPLVGVVILASIFVFLCVHAWRTAGSAERTPIISRTTTARKRLSNE